MKSSLLLEFPNNPPSSFKGLEFFLDHEVVSPHTTNEGVAGIGGARGGSLSVMHAAI